ncbi:VRR-NUC domain-containing protein [Podospora conica]|nr:VRR-NUC domain-containing protein [Schizothecium conicum]
MDRFVKRTKPAPSSSSLAAGSKNARRKSEEPPFKKPRVERTKDSDDDDEDSSFMGYERGDDDLRAESMMKLGSVEEMTEADVVSNGEDPPPHRETAFEKCLPAVSTDTGAIEEYEAMRASQLSHSSQSDPKSPVTAASRMETRQWVRGRSSIYVDAFNLALDTVLEDEAHLFDNKEQHVFDEWKSLSYEAQYLYVRLFLRKASLWHRIERLSSYSDISGIDVAVSSLLERRDLPEDENGDLLKDRPLEEMQEWSLGESFQFVDDSESYIKTIEEAASLLSLDELKTISKEAKVQGKNKAELLRAFCQNSSRQRGLLGLGLRRANTNESGDSGTSTPSRDESPEKQGTNRNAHFFSKILAMTGPLIRLSEPVFKLFERAHLVFYRSTEWTEKSLTAIILAKCSRRNFPQYLVCRSSNIFPSRRHLLEFEHSMRAEYEVDKVLEFNGPPGEEGLQKVVRLFEAISPRWRQLLREEEDRVYEFCEGGYLRRFNAAHAYTRIAHKAASALGRLHRYEEEHKLLSELLSQRLFHPGRRGSWYQRKALLEERYMWEVDPHPASADQDAQKKYWNRVAAKTCETALGDRDCHLIYHYDLQKRLLKLEKRLRIPKREQHDFGHVKLHKPEEHTVTGIQLVRDDPAAKGKMGRGPSMKTIWLDELGEPGDDGKPAHVSVEDMCLSYYRSQGWKGYHSEGGILRTLFAYLFFDVLFVYIPNVFQTAFQTCPLDLHTDAFFPARASEINHRLVEISNGGAERLLREVDERERERRTCVVGLNWDFEIGDLVELVQCFDGQALAAVCKVMAQDYKSRGGGVPDLILWRPRGRDGGSKKEVMFSEVKSANDRLSDTQRLWIHVLTGAGIRVALCNAVAKEVRTID